VKDNQKVIDQLNILLTGELTAMDIYFVHSRMCHDWGISQIAERLRHELDDELGHANLLIERILFLGGTPNIADRQSFEVKTDLQEILRMMLDDEYNVAKNLKDAIQTCEKESDFESRSILGILLKDTEEDHIYWLETQLKLINSIGTQNYIQTMMS
jgi:bacterioferritin